ncbi:capsule biosynthesis protein [Stappia sp. MMSF_3263]|uniref:capsule biosynthesis protein n=1 Tax=Stappia sp. MMSF_3263 TaxID=3046693 RepID=UPI00273E2659|nr:capsular biosynthesis protein [Stappia sp. MMSF_3263]
MPGADDGDKRRLGNGEGDAVGRRHFLFLQGPLSPLYRRIGARLRKAGHRVSRVNFCAGDWLHWHGQGTECWRGSLAEWPDAVAGRIAGEAVSDLVLHGDTRPYHRPAVLAAEAMGIAVHVTELGLLRPGFMTLERGGLATLSRFPDDPATIRDIARTAGEPDLSPRFPGSFALEAWQDLSYHLPNVAAAPFFPHYRRHTPLHPLHDYALWLRRLATAPGRRRIAARRQAGLLADPRPFFVLPLQIEGDYQLVAHSPFASMREALELVVRDFLDNAPEEARLVVKTHPLDNGLVDWARECGGRGGGRVVFLDGGSLDALWPRACGLVTVNSTAGLDALRKGVPVKTLVPALYDIDGMTHQGDLASFWRTPTSPDRGLVGDFVTALAATTQLRGSIHNREGLKTAVETISARLLGEGPAALNSSAEPPRLARARALGVGL